MILNLKVFLEGPYVGGQMMIQHPNVPTTNPYGLIDVLTPNTDTVDWLKVSLREDPNSGTEEITVPGLLQRDGNVILPHLTGFDATKQYYILVEHRNHMRVQSHEAISFTNNVASYDFTIQDSYIGELFPGFPFGTGQKQYGSTFVMLAGETVQDGDVNSLDDSIISNQMGQMGYLEGDVDFDGKVTTIDRQLWFGNSGNNTLVQD